MFSILLDSSNTSLTVGLAKDDILLESISYEAWQTQSEHMIPELDKLLDKYEVARNQISDVVVGIGPGSYTGVRMACTVAKMIGAFKHIPVYEISTLALISSGMKGKCLSNIDARRGNAFAGIYNNGILEGKEAIVNKEEFLSIPHDSVANESDYKVNPLRVIEIAKLHDNPHSLKPNYLQETEAERNLKENENKTNE